MVINNDIWLNILLQSDMKSLKTSCNLNKITNKICQSDSFWIMKFEQDGLFLDKKFKSLDKWMKEYTKIKTAMDVADKLVNYLIDKKTFNIIGIYEDIDLDKINWPLNINEAIHHSENDMDRSLEFDVENLSIVYMYIPIYENGDEGEDYINTILPVTKQEFITYLAKVFYYFPQVRIIDSEEIWTSMFLSYQDLQDKTVKKQLPDW